MKYNKTEQALLATNGSVTLGATLQYKFNGATVDAEAVKGLAAGNYDIVPTVAGTDNTIAKDFNDDAFTVTIAPKDVYISVQNKTKVYDGSAFDLGTAVIDINGLEAGDVLTGGVTAKYATAPADAKNVGEYTVTTTGGTNTNYNITRLATGKFTINARPIILTAKPQAITFGEDAPVFAVNETYIDIQAKGADEGCAIANTADGYAAEVGYILNAIESVGLKETKTDIGTYTGNIVITPKATAATVAPNYEISVVAGTYTINAAGGYTLIAQNKNVTYGEAYTLTYLAPNGDVKAGKTVTYDVYKGEVKLDANPTDAGTYTIKIQPNTYAPDNFGGEEAEINYVDGLLVIAPKALKIIPQEQTLRVGKKATDLVATMVDFEGVEPGDEGKIDYTLAFNGATVDGNGALTNVETINDGIKAVLSAPAETNRNANYTLNATASVGKLIVVNAETLILGNNEASDLADLATYNGAPVTVKINLAARNGRSLGGERNWVKENWVTLTLPFDITVAQLSQKLGYAIVNEIDPSSTKIDGTGSKFYGKLTMKGAYGKDYLPANKPILVKIADNIANVGVAGVVDFGEQTIVAPADAAACTVDAGEGAKFVGTYASKEVTKADKANIWFMIGGGYTQWAYIKSDSEASWTIKPYEAFIDMSGLPASARNMTFFFEELDGSVTAIKSISADNLNNKQNAEGWYNLNGVKLNGAPTQKGIYINNGKKIVIK